MFYSHSIYHYCIFAILTFDIVGIIWYDHVYRSWLRSECRRFNWQ